MPTIRTHKELQAVWHRNFCYICGEALDPESAASKDHVPPTSLFATEDRDPPLILPTHHDCNQKRSAQDEPIGQLVSLLHGRVPRAEVMKLSILAIDRGSGQRPRGGLRDFPFMSIVYRWVRGFHVACTANSFPTAGGAASRAAAAKTIRELRDERDLEFAQDPGPVEPAWSAD